MNEVGMPEQQSYGDDFWPGFVDILSGLILIFSFLILVAGVVIAVIYQTFSTVIIPPTKFTHVLAIIQRSPLMIPAQYDIIEEIKRESRIQVLVQKTQQQLEDIGERTNRVLEDFPDLKRQLQQEINFLQEQIRLVKVSPPPEGRTQKPVDNQGGRLVDRQGTNNIPIADSENWETSLIEDGKLFIAFDTPDSLPPTGAKNQALRGDLKAWLDNYPNLLEPKVYVANAIVPYAGIASRDALRRALYLRELFKQMKAGIRVKIISVENDRENQPNGWIEIGP